MANLSEGDGQDAGRDPVAKLLQRAGKRAAPAPEMAERIRVQVHAAWRQEVARRRRYRWMAIAASVFTVAIGGWWASQMRMPGAPQIVASVERSAADFSVRTVDGKDRLESALDAGKQVALGDRLETGPGSGAVLSVPGAGGALTVRLSPATRLVWQAADRVQLLRGQVYFDSGAVAPAASAFSIEADGVLIQHVGTRFLVSLSAEQLDVKVRDGSVRIEAPGEVALLGQGEHGRLQRGAAQIERLRVESSGDDWSWVDTLAPRLVIENQSLLAVLQRVAHEGGFVLRFESDDVEREAGTTVLHGPELAMPPRQALDAILVTTGFVAVHPDNGAQLLINRR